MLHGLLLALHHLLLLRTAIEHHLRVGYWPGKAALLSLRHRLPTLHRGLLASGGSVSQLLVVGRVVVTVGRVLRGHVCTGNERTAGSRGCIELLRRGCLASSGLAALLHLGRRRLVRGRVAAGVAAILAALFAVEDGIDAEGRGSTNRWQPYEGRLAMRGFRVGLQVLLLRLLLRLLLKLLLMLG